METKTKIIIRSKIFYLLVILALLTGFVSYCQTPTSVKDDQHQTLSSLKKVDDFPLYTMHFYGDYGFKDLLKTGIQNTGQSGLKKQAEKIQWACTCFAGLNKTSETIFGRNFDWYNHPALLLFTDPPDGYAAVSMVDISYLGFSKENPPTTKSERLLETPLMPFDGMNENGLVVGMMAVPNANGGNDSHKKTLSSLQVIRLMLDHAKDVDEAISLLQNYNVDFQGGPPVHYLIADSSRNSAVIEYIDNEIIVVQDTNLWQVSTNFIINNKTPQQAKYSCWRYKKAYETLDELNGNLTETHAMQLLKDVSQSNTIWSVVYNLFNLNFEIVMDTKYGAIHKFELK